MPTTPLERAGVWYVWLVIGLLARPAACQENVSPSELADLQTREELFRRANLEPMALQDLPLPIGVAHKGLSVVCTVETLRQALLAKQRSVVQFASTAHVQWWSLHDSSQASPPGGVVQRCWWTSPLKILSLEFLERESLSQVRIDTVIENGVALRTIRDASESSPPIARCSEVHPTELYAQTIPLVQAGVSAAAEAGVSVQPSHDLVHTLETKPCEVLPELVTVLGRDCIVMTIGSPAQVRVYLSVEDALLPVRAEYFKLELDADGQVVGHRCMSISQVLECMVPEHGWPVAKCVLSATIGPDRQPVWAQLVTVASVSFGNLSADSAPLLRPKEGTILVSPDGTNAVLKTANGASIDGAIGYMLKDHRYTLTPWNLASWLDRGFGVLVFAAAALVIGRARRHA